MPAAPDVVTFALLGRRLAARGADARLAAWLHGAWDHPPCSAAPLPYEIEITLAAAGPPVAPAAWPETDVAIPGHVLRFRSDGHRWQTGDPAAGLRLELHEAGARIACWRGPGEESPPPAWYHGLYVAVTEAVRASGLVPLHAAVASRGGETVAWLGSSGVGKSTTLLFAAEAGWRAIAEDLCWLEPGTLRVYGWDRGVRCRPETLERFFPHFADAPPAPDGKRIVAYERLGGDAAREGTLTELVLLGRADGGPSRRTDVRSRDVVRALWEATGVPLGEASRAVTSAAVERLSRLPAGRLVLGPPPLPLAGARGADQASEG